MTLRRGLAIVWRSLLLAGVLVLGVVSPALADRAFNARFSTNASGDVAIVGNTLESCQSSVADCVNARAGKGSLLNNNNFLMERVDIDHTMFDSSSARLTLPDGARVLFAGLYYGARTTAGTRGKAAPEISPSAFRTVDLRLPGGSGYERLVGALDESSEVKGAYGVFVDVTKQVRRAGSGLYTVANVQSATGEDRYAGWALVVAYEAAGDPPRNLTVFDGLQSVTQGKPALTIPVSGFQTPLSGPVRTKLGFVAYEGDLGLSGDSAALDGKPLTDAVNPANNFFNSAISLDGRHFTDKTPDYVNQLGFDAKLIGIDGILANGARSANIALRTSSDQYLPQVTTFATDLYAPVIHATKGVANLTHPDGPARPGDTLRYTVTYTNQGLEAARDFVAEDVLPSGTTFLPGSLRIPGAPASIANPSDVQGDDLGEYEPARGAVRFFLGSGAAAGRGGELAVGGQPGDRAQISLEVRVDENGTAKQEITNVAQATFLASTLGKELSALSSPATIAGAPGPPGPAPADLALAQSESVAPLAGDGEVVDDHITIENHGPGDATNVQLHDTLPPGALVESASTDQGTCSVQSTEITCTVPHLDSGGSVEINPVAREPAGDAAAGSRNEATVTAAQLDPNPANNSRDETAPEPPSSGGSPPAADLSVQAHESSHTVPLGGALNETITVANNGPDTATAVDITDVLGAATELTAIRPGSASCTSQAPLHCTLATVPAGSRDTIKVSLRPLRPGQLIDAVSISGDQPDTNYANNIAKVAATVKRRATAASVRITPIQPVANAGQVVGFVIIAAVTKPTPAITPVLCVTVPAGLRLTSAPGATRNGPRLCWHLGELISGKPRSFRLYARVGAVPSSGATLNVPARLTGENFAARRSAAIVQVPPQAVACPSSVSAHPQARIAC